MRQEYDTHKGIIAWFAHNTVAANLLMIFIIIMGMVAYFNIQRQTFPDIETNFIRVNVSYPGASPQEIEEGILIKIEEAIKDVTEIDRVVSRAFRNSGHVHLDIDENEPLTEVLDKVKARVDGIATFPADMEPVNIQQLEFQQQVIETPLVGDLPLQALKKIAREIEDELLQLDNISLVEMSYPDDEIAVEILPDELRKYNLSIADIASAIRSHSTNLSAGQLRTHSGIISVRVENQFYQGEEFGQIPVKLGQNGARVLLQDVATIKDDFTEGEQYFRFSGKNAIYISVRATKSQNIIPVADTVKAYIEQKNPTLPEGVSLETMVDLTYYLNQRLDMMLKNLLQGAVLVALMLTVFLRFRLAFWVMLGLPVCFLGAIMMMPVFGVSINLLSLFAFIMVLGIVVDDAIVIGESAYSEIEQKGGGIESAIIGAKKVATPATFGVLTTIAVFAPFTMSSGFEGQMFYNIAIVVILCLVFSLVESKLILPAHIANTRFSPVKPNSLRARFNHRFNQFVNVTYRGFLNKAVAWRWAVMASFSALLMLSVGLIQGDHVRVVPSSKVPHDFPQIRIEMNENVSDTAVIEALKTIEGVILQEEENIKREFGGEGMVKNILAFNDGRTQGEIVAPLVDESLRVFDTFELARRWRKAIPEIPGMKSFIVLDDLNSDGDDGEFGFLLYGPELKTLNAAGLAFIDMLQQQDGLFDVSSTMDPINKEIQMTLLPVAYDLGLTLQNVASQIGASLYGGEAQRVIRDGEEVRVMVRYPALTRQRLAELKYSVITTPAGRKVMLGDVVALEEKPGISYIRRESGYRSIYIWGNIDEQKVEPTTVIDDVYDNLLPKLQEQYPDVVTELGGDIEEQQAQMDEQLLFFVAAMIMVFILLAVPLKSYGQPLIIMSVIPFSFTGAALGHYVLGYDISSMSFFGLIAAAGVVINDSLVMTDFINQRRKQGCALKDAVTEAGTARFRAITLTSITTFVGVLPIMFETSMQAAIMIPMAVALGFAVLYATVVTLVLVPCLYLILIDIAEALSWCYRVSVGKLLRPSSKSSVSP
ncbi:efflux RND transporter permease subunit [Aestuariibacter sp. A3R04]|uniref:efflux RND transporter permease subunit n=1 Tax=Aestuariibacter sp. A3R04 TaxID=2841571 RepID=UPI001C091D3A|nr:efflux RND transporter permease subunit [Aestuariibacter sp. A3R04]MBU3022462.1 efflux RND transporter permease subunit [Aestuariibacter sp. A3R04]